MSIKYLIRQEIYVLMLCCLHLCCLSMERTISQKKKPDKRLMTFGSANAVSRLLPIPGAKRRTLKQMRDCQQKVSPPSRVGSAKSDDEIFEFTQGSLHKIAGAVQKLSLQDREKKLTKKFEEQKSMPAKPSDTPTDLSPTLTGQNLDVIRNVTSLELRELWGDDWRK